MTEPTAASVPVRNPLHELEQVIHALVAEHGLGVVLHEVQRASYEHGTIAAARWHHRTGDPMCEPCRLEWAAYYRAYHRVRKQAAESAAEAANVDA